MTFKYDEVKCPDCDGEMVSRTGKFGVFWGCKNFPRCKGTRDNQGRSKAERQAERPAEDKDDIEDQKPTSTHTKTSWNKK